MDRIAILADLMALIEIARRDLRDVGFDNNYQQTRSTVADGFLHNAYTQIKGFRSDVIACERDHAERMKHHGND